MMKRCAYTLAAVGAALVIGCGPNASTPAAIENETPAPEAQVPLATATLMVKGMDCEACTETVTAALEAAVGVSSAIALLDSGVATVVYNPAAIKVADLLGAVNGAPSGTFTATVRD